jgi:boron transporter
MAQEDDLSDAGSCRSRADAEILDELTTNRGELKHRTSNLHEERHLEVKRTV